MELFRRGDALQTLTPDLLVDEDFDLSPRARRAESCACPDTRGSIGCSPRPVTSSAATCSISWRKVGVPMDDAAAHAASMAKLRRLDIRASTRTREAVRLAALARTPMAPTKR